MLSNVNDRFERRLNAPVSMLSMMAPGRTRGSAEV
jgi:hypothetical protein